MADLVLGDRAHGHVLLEERRDAGPLGVPVTDDELVVGHGEEETLEARLHLGTEPVIERSSAVRALRPPGPRDRLDLA